MRKDTCKHFRGTTCDVGVAWPDLVGALDPGWFLRMPCLRHHKTDLACDLYTEPTDEELAEYMAARDQATANMRLAVPIIRSIKQKHMGQDARGFVVCPVCEGKLHYTHAGWNGHVHGGCETNGCLSWME